MKTDRDLYREVITNVKKRSGSERTLGQYLNRLLELISVLSHSRSLTLEEFTGLLDAAFDGDISSVNQPLLRRLVDDNRKPECLRYLARQIVDLHEMEAAGILDDKARYFGLDAPSGSRWYNFDPTTFIECGMTGSFGGWEPSDDSGRQYVPGLVAVVDADGNVSSAKPEDLVDPIQEMVAISWDEFSEFLWSGQCYE